MEKKSIRTFLLMTLTGFLMGIAAIAPGVSGGAIAVIFDLYEPITEAVGTLWKDFRRKLRFLTPLGIGAALGMLLFGRLIHFLFSEYTAMTCAVFVGLIAGTLPSVFRTAARDGFRLRYLIVTVLFAMLVGWITTLKEIQYSVTETALSHGWMALCGAILGLGSVLPGTSASFVLMALGVYEPMLAAVNELDILRIALLGVGFGVTFLLLARLVSWVYKKAYGWMSFAVIGMLLGSVYAVLPTPANSVQGVWMIVIAVVAAAVSYGLLCIKS